MLLASVNALGVIPKSLNAGRSPLVRTQSAQTSLRKARTIQSVWPRHVKIAALSMPLRAERGLSRWLKAQRAYSNNMVRMVAGCDDPSEIEDASIAWLRDQNDPDNWLIIPEFGVNPQSVAFKGFAFPIVGPCTENPDAANSIRAMLRAGRKKIRSEFATQSSMMSKALEAHDTDVREWSALHRSAFAFHLLAVSIDEAVKASSNLERRFSSLAQAGSILAAWITGDTDAIVKMKRFQSNGSIGGLRSAVARQEKAIDKASVAKAAKELGWPGKRYGILKRLSINFDCTANHIGEILKENSMIG